jgi:CENP-B N-terminal DNA-binding domain
MDYEPLVVDSPEYRYMHRQIPNARGAASEYNCYCGASADCWAWQHGQNPYDVYSYDPMCWTCHLHYDGVVERNRGEGQGAHKLTEDKVLEIRRLYEARLFSQDELAKMFGVCQKTVSKVVARESWRHI